MVRAPGVITNKINTSLYRNHNHNRCRFCLPFPPFYADSSAELSQLQVVVVTSGAFTFTSVIVVTDYDVKPTYIRQTYFKLSLDSVCEKEIVGSGTKGDKRVDLHKVDFKTRTQ